MQIIKVLYGIMLGIVVYVVLWGIFMFFPNQMTASPLYYYGFFISLLFVFLAVSISLFYFFKRKEIVLAVSYLLTLIVPISALLVFLVFFFRPTS